MVRGFVRLACVVAGIAALALAAGFLAQAAWATALWPFPDGRLSYIFMAAIMAGAALPLLWIGLSGALAALYSYALGFSVLNGGMAGTALLLYARGGSPALLRFGLASGALTALCVVVLLWSAALPGDPRPMPRALRLPFWIEVAVLALVGSALLLRVPDVLPWPLRPEASLLYGWVFLGLALYFGYAPVARTWQQTQGQLLGFLAYDLVLIGPFLAHFGRVQPQHRLGLIVATAIVVGSAALAVAYLVVFPATRRRVGGSSAASTPAAERS